MSSQARPEHAARWIERWPYLAHLAVVLFLFWGVLFEGRLPYFRDLLTQYYPDYVFVARAAGEGIAWPLWNPLVHAGAPFLVSYPLELAAVLLFGPGTALRWDAPIHVFVGMCGASLLGRGRGLGTHGAWAVGLFYGLSGFVLSSTNLIQLLHAAAWAPFVIAAVLRVLRVPDARACALLALALAVLVSTLSLDILIQTALACIFLLPRAPDARRCLACAAAAALAALIAAPALVGTSWLMAGTRRALGFDMEESLGFSASPLVLLEALLPHFFGDVRSFSEAGYWGKPFFGGVYPYFMSLYVGPSVLLLACLAGPGRARRALWALVALGVLLSLGKNGPFAAFLPLLLRYSRFPIKFFFLVNLALCLLAGQGVDRIARERARITRLRFAPGALLLLAALALVLWPEWPSRAFSALVPELQGPGALSVVRTQWPAELLRAGALCLGAALALGIAARGALLAALLSGLDLLAANTALHPTARGDFYELAPPVRALVERARALGTYRWFTLSLNAGGDVRFWTASAGSDVVAYRAARQSLLGMSSLLDGLESALEQESAFAPQDSVLPLELRRVERFREYFPDLRLANVRWVLSLHRLPDDRLRAIESVELAGLVAPLRLYELVDPLERAFWVPRCEVAADPGRSYAQARQPGFQPKQAVLLESPPAGTSCDAEASAADSTRDGSGASASVRYERLDVHTVRLRVQSPPGFVVVLTRYHRDWRAEGARGALPLQRAYGRYWALATPGGEQTFVVRFRPAWPAPALFLSAIGLGLFAFLVARPPALA
jgi:hypothetical protein